MKRNFLTLIICLLSVVVYAENQGQSYDGIYISVNNQYAKPQCYTSGSHDRTIRFWFTAKRALNGSPRVLIRVTDKEGNVVTSDGIRDCVWATLSRKSSLFSAYLDFPIDYASTYKLELLPEDY